MIYTVCTVCILYIYCVCVFFVSLNSSSLPQIFHKSSDFSGSRRTAHRACTEQMAAPKSIMLTCQRPILWQCSPNISSGFMVSSEALSMFNRLTTMKCWSYDVRLCSDYVNICEYAQQIHTPTNGCPSWTDPIQDQAFAGYLNLLIRTGDRWRVMDLGGHFSGDFLNAASVIYNYLVVELPLWKIWKSMGRMTSHIFIYYRKWKMFETTNHYNISSLWRNMEWSWTKTDQTVWLSRNNKLSQTSSSGTKACVT